MAVTSTSKKGKQISKKTKKITKKITTKMTNKMGSDKHDTIGRIQGSVWNSVSKNPGQFLKDYEDQPDIVANVVKAAMDLYHGDGESPISDAVWDILYEWLGENHPDHPVLTKIGEGVSEEIEDVVGKVIEGGDKQRVALPFHMGSMDKIKPDSGALVRWQKKFPGDVLVTTKLDGVSFLLTYMCQGVSGKAKGKTGKDKKQYLSGFKMFTRGNGKIGTDITNLLPYFTRSHPGLKKLASKCESDQSRLTLRGEVIMERDVFDSRYSQETGQGDFKNARNLVAGVVNSKKIIPSIVKDLDLVCYEVMEPRKKPSTQYLWLQSIGFKTAQFHLGEDGHVDADSLSEDLITYRESSPYEIDGLVVLHDKLYPVNKSGNPKNAFAFKTLVQHDRAETTVMGIEWNASKHGYLKPRLTVRPVKLDGVTIHHATGFNAGYIRDQGIGPGAKIVIVRSGGVIPHIVDVTTRVAPALPDENYTWTEGGVDIVLDDIDADEEVILKKLISFFQKIDTKHVGPGITRKLMEAIIDKYGTGIEYPEVLYRILKMTQSEIGELDGFQPRLAERTYNQIQSSLQGASLVKIMAASQICGRGMGERRMEMIFKVIPDLLTLVKTQKKGELVERICEIEGFQTTTAIPFVDSLPDFLKFYQEIRKIDTGREAIEQAVAKTAKPAAEKTGRLAGKKFLFTGGVCKECQAHIESLGGEFVKSYSKQVDVVIAKDKQSGSSKLKKAEGDGKTVIDWQESLKL